MQPLMTHKGYEVWATTVGRELWATIKTPRRIIISEVPAVAREDGEAALRKKAKTAIERDILTRA